MRRKLISTITALTMVTSLVGCGGGSSTTATTSAGGNAGTTAQSQANASSGGGQTAEGATTIEVWTINRHDEVYMNEMIEKFNAEHDDIQINYTIFTDEWVNTVQLAYQAGTGPDIITMASADNFATALKDYVDSGMFVNLSDYIAADNEFQQVTEVYDHMYEGMNVIGDDIYWVPTGLRSGTRIQYNKEVLQEAGFDEIPATLEELVEMCKVITENGNGSTYGVGFTSSSPFPRWLEGIGQMSGFNHAGYDYKTGTYDFSQWKPLLETANRLVTDGSVLPGSETQGVDNGRALFAQGSFAVWGNASQEAGVFTEQFPCDFEWGVAELPTMDGEVKGALSTTPLAGFTMMSSSQNKDAAWDVIKYFSSEDFLKGYFEGGYTSPISSYMDGKIDKSKVGRLADFEIQSYESVYPSTPAVVVEGDVYTSILWEAVLGNITADEAIEDLNTRYNAALERGLANGSCTRIVIEDFDPLSPATGTITYRTE